jgi:hypothetical protein
MEFRLHRENDVDIAFTGTLLADVSSRIDSAERWTEIRIYRTDSNKYVVEQVGKSIVEDEVDRRKVHIVRTPDCIRKVLRRKDEVEYLTKTAQRALRIAGYNDIAIAQTLVERI